MQCPKWQCLVWHEQWTSTEHCRVEGGWGSGPSVWWSSPSVWGLLSCSICKFAFLKSQLAPKFTLNCDMLVSYHTKSFAYSLQPSLTLKWRKFIVSLVIQPISISRSSIPPSVDYLTASRNSFADHQTLNLSSIFWGALWKKGVHLLCSTYPAAGVCNALSPHFLSLNSVLLTSKP